MYDNDLSAGNHFNMRQVLPLKDDDILIICELLFGYLKKICGDGMIYNTKASANNANIVKKKEEKKVYDCGFIVFIDFSTVITSFSTDLRISVIGK